MSEDIFELVDKKEQQACKEQRHGVVISPGALGDCLLMLPLAKFMKESLRLGRIDFIGHTNYIDYFPGRTCIDGIRSIDSIEFHRLFAEENEFTIEENDALVSTFGTYEWIASFLGQSDINFENNLIFTVNCIRSAEISFLPFQPHKKFKGHISEFYIKQFINSNLLTSLDYDFKDNEPLIKLFDSDYDNGREILESIDINTERKIVIMHPGSGGVSKCWHRENFCRLADFLKEKDYEIVFLLGPTEIEIYNNEDIRLLDFSGKCIKDIELSDIMKILAFADLFIGNDSGVSHLAGGVGTKTLAIFGPTDPLIYKPIGPNVETVTTDSASFTDLCENSIQYVKSKISAMLNI